jgi:hypothetical protein
MQTLKHLKAGQTYTYKDGVGRDVTKVADVSAPARVRGYWVVRNTDGTSGPYRADHPITLVKG